MCRQCSYMTGCILDETRTSEQNGTRDRFSCLLLNHGHEDGNKLQIIQSFYESISNTIADLQFYRDR